jgi:glycosyltransferase involved in cell wall biosynthesis
VLTVAYLANQFPSPVEPYVADEIEELRLRGVRVIAGSVRRPAGRASFNEVDGDSEFVVLQPVSITVAVKAAWLCLCRWQQIADLFQRVIFRGRETPLQRSKALLHTWLGACYALRLQKRGVEHIHVHHGYFGSWIAMVAARLLNVSYSLTLHGSDLLTHAAYLDTKLKHCRFCMTISEYNRHYILDHYSTIEPGDVVVARLGVDVPEAPRLPATRGRRRCDSQFQLLAIGRLHAVKDHAFLLQGCAQLRRRGLDFKCEIAGEGPERRNLERLIREYGLEDQVRLLGHVPRERHDDLYQKADLVVLTSRSEGIPLVLMEAMAREKIVLAPEITGIPELVTAGQTGFLYQPKSMDDFVTQLVYLHELISRRPSGDSEKVPFMSQLDWVRYRAREQVRQNFNREKNLQSFSDLFLERVTGQIEHSQYEDPLLQQI